MKESQQKPFDHFLHPYIFVLKEGKEINSDFLDYSLLLLQVGKQIFSIHHDILPLESMYLPSKFLRDD